MAGVNHAPGRGDPGDPGGSLREKRQPDWMLSDDEIGQTMVLLLRRKSDENGQNTQTPLPNPFIITASIEVAVGAKEVKKVGMVKEGRGTRYLLRTNLKSIYRKLTGITRLTDGTVVEVISHPTLNKVQGTVFEADSTDVDEETLLNHLKSQGIQAVRRITKKVNGTVRNTPLVVLTFHGTMLPEAVYFGGLRVAVRSYYPAPIICFQCGTYGHPRKFCQQSGICLQCSQAQHVTEGEQCSNAPYCMHCQGAHSPIARICPKYKDEVNVIRIRVDKKISPAEARRIYAIESQKETIASEVQKRLRQEESSKDKIIAELRAEVESLKRKLEAIVNDTRLVSPNVSRPEKTTVSVEPSSSKPKQNSQRLSRKDKTFVSPPPTHSDTRRTANLSVNEGIRTRSKSRKHLMEMSPTDASSNSNKRATLIADTGGTSDQ